MLYHVSEEPGLSRFEPRVYSGGEHPVVWAVDERRLRNYLLPRDCPRVTFYAGPATTPEDRDRFLGASEAVVAFESSWLDRVRHTTLHCYALPAETFTCVDECAGYHHSRVAVTAKDGTVIEDPLAALALRGVEVRIIPTLWTLFDAVASSSLAFSMIRMRNATPRNTRPAPRPAQID